MNILLFSSILLALILLVQYFYSIKLLIVFGITFGFFAIGLNFLFDSCFGASSPIDLKTQNLTEQNLKIYAIIFCEDLENGNVNYTKYDSKLEPKKTSKFCIDNDCGKFWLVAKNEKDEIKYLEEVSNNESKFEFAIRSNDKVEIDKVKIAKELTFKTDKNIRIEKYLLWTNVILILLLVMNLRKN